MHVMILGSGGRERALAWSCERSGHRVTLSPTLEDALNSGVQVDLVIPGPEQLLVDGVADRCRALGIPCFGPTAELTRWESSKSWARKMADHLGIPGPASAEFNPDQPGQIEAAIRWWRDSGHQVVVKLDGLAGGKGVTVPVDDDETITAIRSASEPFLLEERLHGPEVSLLALCDGHHAVALPLAQDHKRIGEGDTGPNTGGMGAYAPAPLLDTAGLEAVKRKVLEPTLAALRARGIDYRGVIYAGLMLTEAGPSVIEFNCRFGDPECETLMPLLGPELAAVLLACARGRLDLAPALSIAPGCSACVIAAAQGYPGEIRKGDPISSQLHTCDNLQLFHAGSRREADGRCLSSGGRVLAVVAQAHDFDSAFARAYAGLDQVHFDGMTYRRDIGHQVRRR